MCIRDRARLAVVLGLLTVVLAVALGVGAAFGDQPVSVWRALRDGNSLDATLLWRLRLPRVLLAALVGAALSGSGCALQALLRNPLADPFVLGVSGGAALGATLAMAIGVSVVADAWGGAPAIAARWSAPSLFAFVGAGAATLLVAGAGRMSTRAGPTTALLTGVVFNAFAAAAITCIKALSSPERTGDILFWLAGALGYEVPSTLVLSAMLQLAALGTLLALSGRLNLLSLGDEEAAALGVPVASTRRALLLATSASVGGAVALSGMVGFVGLMVPHLLRRILGPDQRLLLPASVLGGGAFLVLADLAARLLFPLAGTELPVGVLTALLGGPFFLWQLRSGGRGA